MRKRFQIRFILALALLGCIDSVQANIINFSGDSSVGIDNVTLTQVPVPEPSAMLFFGMGFLSLVRIGRPSKRK